MSTYSLRVLGRPLLEGEDGPVLGRASQRHRLAILALLARSPERSLSRDKLLGYLWPENSPRRARHLLSTSVYVLRQELGESLLHTEGDDLRLDRELVEVDVSKFEEALESGALERAAEAYTGPFLDGFYLNRAPEFERWVDSERDCLASLCESASKNLIKLK